MALFACILGVMGVVSFPNVFLFLLILRGVKSSIKTPPLEPFVRCLAPGCEVLRCARCDGEEHKGPCFADVPEEATEDGLRKYGMWAWGQGRVRASFYVSTTGPPTLTQSPHTHLL